MTSNRRAAALALAALTTAATAAAQAPSDLPGVFGEVLDVRVVNIEVVVTDRDGVPVRGLGAADFRLVVDGEEVPIEYFSEVRGGVAVEPPAGGAVAAVPEVAPGDPVGTSYLVFLDEFFTLSSDRDRVVESLLETLPLLGPDDRMAIVAYDGELEMLSTWSQSPEELARVLKNVRLRPSHGLQRRAERRQLSIDDNASLRFLFDGVDFARSNLSTQLTPQERYYVQLVSEQLDRVVAAAAATLRSFAKPPGRKVMLLFSGGWPFLPTDFLLGDFTRVILDREGLEGENLYRRLVDTANLLGYTLYPIDLPGLDRDLIDVGAGPTDLATLADRDLIREQEVHQTLEYLARETGGRAFLNAARTEAFQRTVSDTRSYYWLGFSPQREWDDRRHEVRVETVAPGYRVRARAGFLDSSRSREVTMAVESALLFGNAAAEPGLAVEVGEPQRKGRRRMEVPLEVLIPLDRVTFLPVGERWASRLELRLAVRDEEGRRAEIPVVPLVLDAESEPAPGQVGRYRTTVRLRRETHEAVVAIYDPTSGRILSAGLTIAP